jgi:acetyl-CoA carboxylase carboxyl transferase subunit alpha
MSIEENELKIQSLEQELLALDPESKDFKELKKQLKDLKLETYKDLTAYDRLLIARGERRIKSKHLINKLFTDFFELKGDQLFAEDSSIISGIGYLKDMPVTVIAQAKGTNITESLKRNFGMTSPEGYRKSLRLAKEAEKFGRPIITIVDTSGAYPGKGAEERGQARAIAENLAKFSTLKVPVICLILSEGGSGGALGLTISDYIYMFENAVYSVLSPEGFVSILFKGNAKVEDVCDVMKMTSKDLLDYGIIDEIIEEPLGGLHYVSNEYASNLKDKLYDKLTELLKKNKDTLLKERYNKFRKIGA